MFFFIEKLLIIFFVREVSFFRYLLNDFRWLILKVKKKKGIELFWKVNKKRYLVGKSLIVISIFIVGRSKKKFYKLDISI